MAVDRKHWRRTTGEKVLTVLFIAAATVGLTLQVTGRSVGNLLLALGIIGNTVLTFRLIARADRKEAAEHARERAERKGHGPI